MEGKEVRERIKLLIIKYYPRKAFKCCAEWDCPNDCYVCLANNIVKEINQFLEEQGAMVPNPDVKHYIGYWKPLRLEVKE